MAFSSALIVRLAFYLVASILSQQALADFNFILPSAGQRPAWSPFYVEWNESSVSPPLSTLHSFSLNLCAGGNKPNTFKRLETLTRAYTATANAKWTFTIGTSLGSEIENAYFMQIISQNSSTQIINYSSRFSITGMKGVFPSLVLDGLKAVAGTAGPAREDAPLSSLPTSSSSTPPPVPVPTSTPTLTYVPPLPSTSTTTQSLNAPNGLSTGITAVIAIIAIIGAGMLCLFVFGCLRSQRRHAALVVTQETLYRRDGRWQSQRAGTGERLNGRHGESGGEELPTYQQSIVMGGGPGSGGSRVDV